MNNHIIKCKKVLVLGSGAIMIGQAGEFDYSGSQAISALKERNIETVLINPNIASIQTSDSLADKIYFLPVNDHFITEVIKKDRPDGILLAFGGQTALNAGISLYEKGILDKYGLKVLGTPIWAIKNTEDRNLFVNKLKEINLKTPIGIPVNCNEECVIAAEKIGYPVMCRIAYALGGLGSGVADNVDELLKITNKAFAHTKQVLIEEYLGGWKEVEYEIVRDRGDNCCVVCSMENIDPMGIHTGESIVVAPVQTLSAAENFKLRSIAIKVARNLGIIGECNIQFAFDPYSDDYRIIEVNARLSRSSALASKATGYPLAFIAANLALGFLLTQIRNSITKETSACFEPALDYVVVKYPRWDLKKFKNVDQNLSSEMKSVGEIMAIARSFEECLQKAVRMLDIGILGLSCPNIDFKDLAGELKKPTDMRMFAVAQALLEGFTVKEIHNLTKIDPWFIGKIANIVELGKRVKRYTVTKIPFELFKTAKKKGLSDSEIACLVKSSERDVRKRRKSLNIIPVVKQIDTLAGEYPAQTNYLYLTYNGQEDDIEFNQHNQVVVLGSGAYRIGSSVEFDWCCVNCARTLNKLKYKTIMINYNPETVSTDYDIVNKMYFEELSYERVMDIYEKENPIGLIVSMGGQIPNNLVIPLNLGGVNILGTSPGNIDRAEDRHKFSQLLDCINIDQPEWNELTSMEEAYAFADKVKYPVIIRPSYVLSGAAMSIVQNQKELDLYLEKSLEVSREHPVVISKFITDAKEIDFDGVAKNGSLHCYAISGHIENAGVHSGDATIVLPPQRTYIETMRKVKIISRRIAKALEITGPFNIQYIAKNNEVKVIECNLRASRSFPFVSKVFKINFIDEATRIMMSEDVFKISRSAFDLDYVGVKAPMFSFTRLKGSDPVCGVEMASTGEVACLGDDFNEAFLKSLISVGYKMDIKSVLLSTGPLSSKVSFLSSLKKLAKMGIKFYATAGTARFIRENGMKVKTLYWPLQKKEPNTISYLLDNKIDLVINIPKNFEEEELNNDYLIRRKAVDQNIPLFTNLLLAKRFAEAISVLTIDKLKIKSFDEYS